MKQNYIKITTLMIKEEVKKIPNWKSPGPDTVQGYWQKKLTTYERIAKQMYNIISSREDIPKWIALGKTVLCRKDLSKGNGVDNYRPISCFPWTLMIGTIAESIYNFLYVNDKLPVELPVEQKGCKKKVEGPKINFLNTEG